MSTVFTDQSNRAGPVGERPCDDAGERHIKTVFVSTLPDDYDPEVADAFARLGANYDEVAARLFEGDPAFEAPVPGVGGAER